MKRKIIYVKGIDGFIDFKLVPAKDEFYNVFWKDKWTKDFQSVRNSCIRDLVVQRICEKYWAHIVYFSKGIKANTFGFRTLRETLEDLVLSRTFDLVDGSSNA